METSGTVPERPPTEADKRISDVLETREKTETLERDGDPVNDLDAVYDSTVPVLNETDPIPDMGSAASDTMDFSDNMSSFSEKIEHLREQEQMAKTRQESILLEPEGRRSEDVKQSNINSVTLALETRTLTPGDTNQDLSLVTQSLPVMRTTATHIQCLQTPQGAPRQTSRFRVPPRLVRLATVSMGAKSRSRKSAPSLFYEEPRRPRQVITWSQANNHRPPLRIDMEGPTPWSYSPRNKPLHETNAPSWTFGARCSPERDGGSRTSWAKTWFQTPHVWQTKVDFFREGPWPSPSDYNKASLLGPRQRTLPESPSYTIGKRPGFVIVKQDSDKEPSPGKYNSDQADQLRFRRSPAYTHQFRREGTLPWASGESTPGPGTYSPLMSSSPNRPAFSIQGFRREKSHVLGPFSAV